MNVAIVSGSIREGRQSYKAAVFLKKKLEGKEVTVDLIDLNDTPLPMFGADSEQAANLQDNVKLIGKRLNKADALILVSPEYHGSFSGVLKNALDYFWSEFQKKPIAVATASAGRMGGINASAQLQHVILSLGAYPLPLKFLVSDVQNSFDDSYNPLNPSLENSANKFIEEFLWLADAVVKKKMNELLVA